ncbi:hypothetical protein EK21DRAFT_106849 [Setomelanomma holmii]|uniref:DUF7730 domain-containing protein n=1 Tax=Setomelanomma holmii TaxID=210430 RepID=A0A9P4LQC2_9PLEO|nr:hypothetical protein EK21DRAFT_106849 [Setomelanomma holmii]
MPTRLSARIRKPTPQPDLRLCFTAGTFSLLRKKLGRGRYGNKLHGRSIRPTGMDFLRVCRQAYYEAAMPLYSCNSFHFDSLESFAHALRTFTAKQRGALRKVHVRIDWGDKLGLGDFMDETEEEEFAALLAGLKCLKLVPYTTVRQPPGADLDVILANCKRFRDWIHATGGTKIEVPSFKRTDIKARREWYDGAVA